MLRFYTEPPAIPEDTPRNVTIIESNRVTLPCPALGTPPPLITWYKDGREITGMRVFYWKITVFPLRSSYKILEYW